MTPKPTPDLDKLERLARAMIEAAERATPGPWESRVEMTPEDQGGDYPNGLAWVPDTCTEETSDGHMPSIDTAHHIALCNPENVRRLAEAVLSVHECDCGSLAWPCVSCLRTERDQLRAEVERLRGVLQGIADITQRARAGQHQRIGAEVCWKARTALTPPETEGEA